MPCLLGQTADPEKAAMWRDMSRYRKRQSPSRKTNSAFDLHQLKRQLEPYVGYLIFWGPCLLFCSIRGRRQARIDTAFEYYENGEYERALPWFMKRSLQRANPDILTTLGEMYLYGQGVDKNPERALSYLIQAAKRKRHRAFFLLGFLLEEGIGCARNDETAVDWYRRAAEYQEINALNNLGMLYLAGRGVPEDPEKAHSLFVQAVLLDSAEAQANVGCLYHEGKGVPRDESAAFRLTRAAAEKGVASARTNLALSYWYGYGVKPDEANALAIMTDVAESGFSPAAAILIDWYETGTDNTASDPEKAAYWRARAARPVPPAEVKTRIYPVSTT